MKKSTFIWILTSFYFAACLPGHALECRENTPCPSIIKTLYSQALSGSPNAQLIIGNMYREGKFFNQNDKKAFQWFDQASRHTPIIAIPNYEVGISHLLGKGTEQRIYKGIQHLEKAAAANSVIAQLILANEYLIGNYVTIDDEKARSYFYQASNSGDLYATYSYGLMLKLGIGGPKNIPDADRLIKQASAQNYPPLKQLTESWKDSPAPLDFKVKQLRALAISEQQKILERVQNFSLKELNDLANLSQVVVENEHWLNTNKKKPRSLAWYFFENGIAFEI